MSRYKIYQIKHIVTGKKYIGSSQSYEQRKKQHVRMLHNGKHHCTPLQNAFDKYGIEAFEFSVIDEAGSIEEMLALENTYLSTEQDLYNVWMSATDSSGKMNANFKTGKYLYYPCVVCGEIRPTRGEGICQSCYMKNRDISGERNPFSGKHHTEETKQKLSTYRLGKKSSSPQCVKVVVDGITYDSMGEASRTIGCSVATVFNRCNSDKFPNYKKV